MSATAKAEAARVKAGLKASAALDKACSSLNTFTRACLDCGESLKGADDSRTLLVEKMSEYSHFLADRYEQKGDAQ